jgi:hypothetical protein
MSYRKVLNKIYTKIDNISRKGPDYIYEYYEYIDLVIKQGNSSALEDVMISKFGIDMRVYPSIEDFRKDSFPKVRFQSINRFQKKLKSLLDQNNIYCIGFHYFDSNNNVYIGDIKEVDDQTIFKAYEDKELRDEIKTINLEVTKGMSSSIMEATPPFNLSVNDVIRFTEDSVLSYQNNYYSCIQSYTWSSLNQITPTYSAYWATYSFGTYSYTLIGDDTIQLLYKYQLAIDWLLT